jgi:hypothetical protein
MILVDGLIFVAMKLILLLPINDRKTAKMKLTVGSGLLLLLGGLVVGPHWLH